MTNNERTHNSPYLNDYVYCYGKSHLSIGLFYVNLFKVAEHPVQLNYVKQKKQVKLLPKQVRELILTVQVTSTDGKQITLDDEEKWGTMKRLRTE